MSSMILFVFVIAVFFFVMSTFSLNYGLLAVNLRRSKIRKILSLSIFSQLASLFEFIHASEVRML